MTVGELIDVLINYSKDTLVVNSNDLNGYDELKAVEDIRVVKCNIHSEIEYIYDKDNGQPAVYLEF